jgi:hypothetical protein
MLLWGISAVPVANSAPLVMLICITLGDHRIICFKVPGRELLPGQLWPEPMPEPSAECCTLGR